MYSDGNLARRLLFHGYRSRAAWRTLRAIPKLPYIDLQFVDSAAQSVAMHAQFTGSAALIALVFLEYGKDKSLLELAHALGVKNVALIHLQNQCFQLIFHGSSLSSNLSF